MKLNKIAIIGAGQVGATTAYTLMLSGLAEDLVLLDANRELAKGNVLDLNHGLPFVNPLKIYSGDYTAAQGADLVIIAAGSAQKPGETRLDLLKRNSSIFKSILDQLLPHCGPQVILLVISNPVDVLTYVTYKYSGLPRAQVVGSGTVLDTARLKFLLAQHLNVESRNIHTYVIGEHGDSAAVVWSVTNVGGLPVNEFCALNEQCPILSLKQLEAFQETTRNAAYEIINKKGATCYAIALAVRRIVECIANNENSILTVSSLLEGQYGLQNLCLSLPTIVNARGAQKILETSLAGDELMNLKRSAVILRENIMELGL